MIRRLILLALLTSVTLGACSKATPSTSKHCDQVPAKAQQAILHALRRTGLGEQVSARSFAAVNSKDFQHPLYFIGAGLTVGSTPSTQAGFGTGLWATEDITGAGRIFAVDSLAARYSSLPTLFASGAEDRLGTDGVAKVYECVREQEAPLATASS